MSKIEKSVSDIFRAPIHMCVPIWAKVESDCENKTLVCQIVSTFLLVPLQMLNAFRCRCIHMMVFITNPKVRRKTTAVTISSRNDPDPLLAYMHIWHTHTHTPRHPPQPYQDMHLWYTNPADAVPISMATPIKSASNSHGSDRTRSSDRRTRGCAVTYIRRYSFNSQDNMFSGVRDSSSHDQLDQAVFNHQLASETHDINKVQRNVERSLAEM